MFTTLSFLIVYPAVTKSSSSLPKVVELENSIKQLAATGLVKQTPGGNPIRYRLTHQTQPSMANTKDADKAFVRDEHQVRVVRNAVRRIRARSDVEHTIISVVRLTENLRIPAKQIYHIFEHVLAAENVVYLVSKDVDSTTKKIVSRWAVHTTASAIELQVHTNMLPVPQIGVEEYDKTVTSLLHYHWNLTPYHLRKFGATSVDRSSARNMFYWNAALYCCKEFLVKHGLVETPVEAIQEMDSVPWRKRCIRVAQQELQRLKGGLQ